MKINNLKLLKEKSIDELSTCDLVDIGNIRIDTDQPVTERVAKFIDDVGNPYCYRCGDVMVKIEFQNQQDSLQERLTKFLIEKKQGWNN